MTRYEEQMYNDIHRIANALEKIAKHLELEKIYSPIQCPKCYSTNVQCMYGTINLDGSGNLKHYICKDCHKEFEV